MNDRKKEQCCNVAGMRVWVCKLFMVITQLFNGLLAMNIFVICVLLLLCTIFPFSLIPKYLLFRATHQNVRQHTRCN